MKKLVLAATIIIALQVNVKASIWEVTFQGLIDNVINTFQDDSAPAIDSEFSGSFDIETELANRTDAMISNAHSYTQYTQAISNMSLNVSGVDYTPSSLQSSAIGVESGSSIEYQSCLFVGASGNVSAFLPNKLTTINLSFRENTDDLPSSNLSLDYFQHIFWDNLTLKIYSTESFKRFEGKITGLTATEKAVVANLAALPDESDLAVAPVPEPTTMALLSLGLIPAYRMMKKRGTK